MSQATTSSLRAPVVQVVLFEDRAQVERRGEAQLEAGQHRLVLDGVAPVLADRSLRVELPGTGTTSARLLDFRVRRERIAAEADLPADLAELREEERRRAQALRVLQQRRTRRAAEREQVSVAAQQLLQEAMEDTAWGRSTPARWGTELEQLWQQGAALDQELLDLYEGHEDAERELAQLRRRMSVQAGPSSRLRCWVELDLELGEPGSVALELSYLVPGACWRPRYRATLTTGASPSLALDMQAAVWQRTGEDWDGVTLRFSTQRPSLGTEPPLLGEDTLRVKPRQEQVVVELREQRSQTTGLGQRRDNVQELPGVDDGGEAVSLHGAHSATVPSDGRPYRVSIGTHHSPATLERVVMAELASAALLRCTTINSAPYPLLAGPVDLVADSGRVGRGKVGFIAPGERLALGFGPDPTLRVFRRHDKVEREAGALSRWDSTTHHVEVLISNLGDEPRSLVIHERVPVSELEQVQIELDRERTNGAAQADGDGIIEWERSLPPGATDQVELGYTLRKRSGVIERG